jgi:Zn-dependent protease
MKENVRLGRIAGVAVGFNWSLILIAAYVAYGLGTGTGRFHTDAPGYNASAYLLAGVFTAVAFLGGVLVHEISHTLVARREGLKVDGIVLSLMGGVTKLSEAPKTPGAELRISGAGPLASLVLGLGGVLAAVVGGALGVSPLAVSVLTWLGAINVLLAVFNMLPGSPLDGGRVVHAVVWWRTGDKYRATRAASRAGWFIGVALLGLGAAAVLTGVLLDGLWLALVGGFLIFCARAESGASAVLESLEGLRAGDVMAHPGVGPGWLTVDAFLREYAGGMHGMRPPAFLLEQWGGGLAGLAPTAAMEAVPLIQRSQVRAGQFVVPVAQLPVFSPDLPAGELVTQMSERQAPWGLVVASGQILGVLSLEGIAAAGKRAGKAAPAVDSPRWSLTRG